MDTSWLKTVILDFMLPVLSHSIPTLSNGYLDCENIGAAIELLFLSYLPAEIYVFPFFKDSFFILFIFRNVSTLNTVHK